MDILTLLLIIGALLAFVFAVSYLQRNNSKLYFWLAQASLSGLCGLVVYGILAYLGLSDIWCAGLCSVAGGLVYEFSDSVIKGTPKKE